MTMKKTIAPGIIQDDYGFEARVSVGSGKNRLRDMDRFPPPDDACTLAQRLAEIQVWQARARLRLTDAQRRTGGPITRGTLAADKLDYLRRANISDAMKIERARQLDWWIQVFPDRRRDALQTHDILQALKSLRTNTKPSKPAAAGTKNHYRQALLHLFVVLDGKHAANPVRDVAKFKEPEALPRDQPYELIDAILANLRDSGNVNGEPSKSKIRLRLLAYAPLTPIQLERLKRTDLDWRPTAQAPYGSLLSPGRNKGAGTDSKRKPLTADALAAFRDFDAANLWGQTWVRPSLLNVFRRALAKTVAQLQDTRPDLVANVSRMRVYDFRHSFGSFVYRTTGGDIHATKELLDHRSIKTTERYTKSAINEHVAAVGRQVAAAMAARPAVAGLLPTTTAHSKNAVQKQAGNCKVLQLDRAVEKPRRKAKTA